MNDAEYQETHAEMLQIARSNVSKGFIMGATAGVLLSMVVAIFIILAVFGQSHP